MLYGLLVTLYVFICFLLVAVILVQKSKGSVGLGGLGGGAQALFGGSGGQDVFQKATWILGAIFIAGSLGLAIMKTKKGTTLRFTQNASAPARVSEQPSPLRQS